jgi:hypothetical protein
MQPINVMIDENNDILISWYSENTFHQKLFKQKEPLTITDLLSFLSLISNICIIYKDSSKNHC